MTSECLTITCPSASSTRKSWPWASIAVALVAVVLVLAGELWAAREAPVLDGAAHEVATEVSSTLATVTAAPILVGPAD
jgi:hypothetical protein